MSERLRILPMFGRRHFEPRPMTTGKNSRPRRYRKKQASVASIAGVSGLLLGVGATHYDFGILTSAMHMSSVKAVAGRLKSDLSYAPSVYDLFPWPYPIATQAEVVGAAAKNILATRATFPGISLAVLYDARTMPPALVKAQATLDRAVDASYGRRAFKSEAERVSYLFEVYEAGAVPLALAPRPAKKAGRPKAA